MLDATHSNTFMTNGWLVTWTEDAGWRAVNGHRQIETDPHLILAAILRAAQVRRQQRRS